MHPWLRWRVILCLIGLIVGFTFRGERPTRGEGLEGKEILQSLRSFETPLQDLQCDAWVYSLTPEDRPSAFRATYQMKYPDKWKLMVTGRFPWQPEDRPDFFREQVGLTVILNGPRLFIYEPFLEKWHVLRADTVGSTEPFSDVGGVLSLPVLAPYAAGNRHLSDLENLEVRLCGTETVHEHPAYLLELTPREPVKAIEPHEVAALRYWIDVERLLPLKAEARDRAGECISVTDYSDFFQTPGGKTLPSLITTTRKQGLLRVAREAMVSRNNAPAQKELWQDEILLREVQIKRYMGLIQGQFLMPEKIEVRLGGEKATTVVYFSNYRINFGLPDRVFEAPVSEEG